MSDKDQDPVDQTSPEKNDASGELPEFELDEVSGGFMKVDTGIIKEPVISEDYGCIKIA